MMMAFGVPAAERYAAAASASISRRSVPGNSARGPFGLPAAQAGAAVDFWSAALGVAARLAPREQQFTVLSGAVGVF